MNHVLKFGEVILCGQIKVDQAVVMIIDYFYSLLWLGKEDSATAKEWFAIDLMCRHHGNDGICKSLFASVVCDWGSHADICL